MRWGNFTSPRLVQICLNWRRAMMAPDVFPYILYSFVLSSAQLTYHQHSLHPRKKLTSIAHNQETPKHWPPPLMSHFSFASSHEDANRSKQIFTQQDQPLTLAPEVSFHLLQPFMLCSHWKPGEWGEVEIFSAVSRYLDIPLLPRTSLSVPSQT